MFMHTAFSFRRFALVVMTAGSAWLVACNNDGENKNSKDSLSTTAPDTASHTQHNPSGPEAPMAMVKHAEVTVEGTYPDTTVTGMAKFDADNGKVKMVLDITVPAKANKSVAVHLHQHGDCGDHGNMSHGHWNPTNVKHGKWGEGEYHLGDIGNVKLDSKGKGSLTIETDRWTLGGDTTSNILGKALIVHGGVDDYKTQPTGNAGGRIGCGVIH
jgi:Cu-Zn family superoxide dismutase